MRPSMLLVVFFSIALLGGAGLFYYQYQLPDVEFMGRDFNERLLKIDSLDSSVSEYALRSRVGLDNNYDMLVRATKLLDRSIDELKATYFNDAKMQGTILGTKFTGFENELETKNDLIESFKSHNSVLRNSEKYAPLVGRELMLAAENQGLPAIAKLYGEVVLAVLEYARPGQPLNAGSLRELLNKIPDTENQLSPEYLSKIIELANHIGTVIEEKEQTDVYLGKALTSTTDTQLEELSLSWSSWLAEINIQRQNFIYAVMAYIAMLLLFTGYIALKLRGLYVSLDGEVAQRTAEVKKVYEDLNQSEKQLMQSEKMASLGQLVAGVAHEINTPLGYITCNLDTVRLNVNELKAILNSSKLLSEVVTQKPLNTKKLGEVIKTHIKAYREIRQHNTFGGIEELLNDSSYGLNEISQLVTSLKDFSRLDSSNTSEVAVHSGLDATLKICSSQIAEREIVKSYADDLPNIECVPAQLNQVFMNILINAAQATDNKGGKIVIETQTNKDGIEIIFKDNGQGMDEETCSRMFDPFFTTKDVDEGTGLGMSISYKIIRSHGGDISVQSEPGEGTEITVSLPKTQEQKNA